MTNSKGHRFEAQLTAVKERLEAAKVSSARGMAGAGLTQGGFGVSVVGGAMAAGAGSRIAKPLRGGGGGAEGGGGSGSGGFLVPTVANLQAQDGAQRRMSWWRG